MLSDPSLGSILLAVDALDECIVDQERLLKLIVRTTTLSRVKWVVSSRNKDEIAKSLQVEAGMKLSLEITENAQQVASAVNSFIDHKMSELRLNEKISSQVRDAMREKADGTFLWVALVSEELRKAKSWRVLQVVQRILSGLVGLYDRMISQIEPETGDEWDLCRPVLATVVLTYRPLALAELGILSGLPAEISDYPEHVRDVVVSCGSFLTVKDEHVYVIHQSVKDYLISRASVFPGGKEEVHRSLYLQSVEALGGRLRRDIYGLAQPGILIGDIDPPDPDPLSAIRYRDLDDEGPVFSFLKAHFLHWLEANKDTTIKIWDVETRSDIQTLRTFSRKIHAVVFSHDSKEVASADRNIIKIWDVATGRLVKYFEGHGSTALSLSFSHDSKQLASGYEHSPIMVWNVATGSYIYLLRGHTRPVTLVTFSHDSKQLASGSSDTIKIWNMATGSIIYTLGHSQVVASVAFSHDSTKLASGSRRGTIKIWDVETGGDLRTFEGHRGRVISVAFSQDSKQVSSASEDCTIKIWDLVTVSDAHTFKGNGDKITFMELSPDLTGSDIHTFQCNDEIASMALSHDLNQLAASTFRDSTVKIWDLVTGNQHRLLEGDREEVRSVAFSHDSKQLASGSSGGSIKIWDIATGTVIYTLAGQDGFAVSVAFSYDSKQLALGCYTGTTKIWDIATGSDICTLGDHEAEVTSDNGSPGMGRQCYGYLEITSRLCSQCRK
ncbi:unnamed protein product [Parascedosporium putredinis]|uniref:WD40 repeat-like protein n=1 Tax=Parascedosporium putredinis TaxID=1442378 RepID=A0A9P1H0K7_9PEZI|nr:unnamed protein product [Parascedosporium putredinis]CAI7991892.1 unnamed protein product [Parascedosporium putredinis]